MKNPFKLKSAIATATSVAVAGAGSAAVDWALDKYAVIPSDWGKNTVNAVKLAAGAVLGSMISTKKNGWQPIAKSACDGIATVAAYNLMNDMVLPAADDSDKTDTTSGLPEGMIGRIRMGQRGFARRINGVGNTPNAFMSK